MYDIILSNIFDTRCVVNEKMKKARQDKSLSQSDLAKLVGVSRQTVNMVESGEYNPTLALCIKICNVLGCTLNDLFWEDNNDVL